MKLTTICNRGGGGGGGWGGKTHSYNCIQCYELLHSVKWQFGLTAFSKGHEKLSAFSRQRERQTEFDFSSMT